MIVIIDKQRHQLDQPFAKGGAGSIYLHPNDPTLAIKIYHRNNDVEPERIKWLCANPPIELEEDGTPTFAWPRAVAVDEASGEIVGFSMPLVRGIPGQAVVDPAHRSKWITCQWLWKLSKSLATRVHTLHLMSPPHIACDINLNNFLIDRKAIATLIDVDSTHFTSPSGQAFTTSRCRPEFQPPELVAASPPVLDRRQDQDAFSLFVVVHRFLREGVHPFDAQYIGPGSPLSLEERIREGIWPHGGTHPEYLPVEGAVPFASLPPALQGLFRAMFGEGAMEPAKRPTVTDLLQCLQNHQPRGTDRAVISKFAWEVELKAQGINVAAQPIRGATMGVIAAGAGLLALAALPLGGSGDNASSLRPEPRTESPVVIRPDASVHVAKPEASHPPAASPLPQEDPPFELRSYAAPEVQEESVPLPTPELWKQLEPRH